MKNICHTMLLGASLSFAAMQAYGQSDASLLQDKQAHALKRLNKKTIVNPIARKSIAFKDRMLDLNKENYAEGLPKAWFDVEDLLQRQVYKKDFKSIGYIYENGAEKYHVSYKNLERVHDSFEEVFDTQESRLVLVVDDRCQIALASPDWLKKFEVRDVSSTTVVMTTGALESFDQPALHGAFVHEKAHLAMGHMQQPWQIRREMAIKNEIQADSVMMREIGCDNAQKIIMLGFRAQKEDMTKMGSNAGMPNFNYTAYQSQFEPDKKLGYPPNLMRLIMLELLEDKLNNNGRLYDQVKEKYRL